MRALVFAGAGIENYDFCKPYIEKDCLVICCDSGMRHAKALGLSPDYIVGDFDSVSVEVWDYYKEQDIPFYQVPSRKDETDMQLGMRLALEKGADDLILFGGIGNRLDHTLANVHLLLWLLKQGVRARLVDERNCAELIDRPTTVYGKAGDIVSTLPLSPWVKGITLRGFSYPLMNKDLSLDDELIAVSNVMKGESAEISLSEGYLLVIHAKD